MTPYRFANQEKKEKLSQTRILVAVFGLLATVLVIIFIMAPLIRRAVRGPAWLAETMAQAGTDAVGSFTPKETLLVENAALKSQLQADQAELVGFQVTADENSKLQSELSYLPNPTATIEARVLGGANESLNNTMIIDQGSDHGVAVGQLVTAQGTVGLGKVASVTSTTATIMLFSGPQFSGDLLMQSQNITVPAIGKGGGNFEIHIPREIKVTDGDLLAFPDMPDIAVGVVKSLIFDSRDPFQTVLASVPVNIQELSFVEVVK